MRKLAYYMVAFVVGSAIIFASLALVVWLAINPWRVFSVAAFFCVGVLAVALVCALITTALEIGEFVLREAGWRKP